MALDLRMMLNSSLTLLSRLLQPANPRTLLSSGFRNLQSPVLQL